MRAHKRESDIAIMNLKQLQESGDIEAAHYEADAVLTWLLNYLGYSDVVEEYDKIKKWYA